MSPKPRTIGEIYRGGHQPKMEGSREAAILPTTGSGVAQNQSPMAAGTPKWQPIDTAPHDGRWVWGEWIVPGRPDLRIVKPMRYGKPPGYVAHWLMNGGWTPGDGPSRWAEMIYPEGETP